MTEPHPAIAPFVVIIAVILLLLMGAVLLALLGMVIRYVLVPLWGPMLLWCYEQYRSHKEDY